MATAVMAPEFFAFKVKHQAHDSFNILAQMQREDVLCDVTLVAQNMEIRAHKNVLASNSRYFYSMFTNYQTAKHERIELCVNPQVLLSVVKYMYTSQLTVLKHNVMDLLEIAKLLLLNSVQDECSNILERTIRPSNCFHIKRVAANYGNSKLLSIASSYIDDNFVDAVASEDFLDLTNDEITELISKDTLKTPSEEKVYECVVKWIKHDQKERRKFLRLLMGHIRLRFISKNYMKQCIVKDPFLKGDSHCKDLIINALLEEDGTADQKIKPRRYDKDKKILLVAGGYNQTASNSLEYYDLGKKCWSTILEIPFNGFNVNMVTLDQKVFAICGKSGSGSLRAVYCYNIDANSWEVTEGTGWRTVKRTNTLIPDHYRKWQAMINRTHGDQFTVAILNDCIYAVGGFHSYNCLSSVEKFDIQNKKWIPIAPMLTNRLSLGVGVLNGILYAVGGEADNTVLDSVECYDQGTDKWKILSSMNNRRRGLGVCTLNGKLYAIGGNDGNVFLSTVEEYNPDTGIWRLITPMRVARAYHAVAVADDQIYVTGGCNGNYQNGTFLNSIEVYDTATNTWTILPISMNVERSHHAAIVVNKSWQSC